MHYSGLHTDTTEEIGEPSHIVSLDYPDTTPCPLSSHFQEREHNSDSREQQNAAVSRSVKPNLQESESNDLKAHNMIFASPKVGAPRITSSSYDFLIL